MLKLEFPNETHREMYERMQIQWKQHSISRVSSKMLQYDNISDFINYMKEDKKWRPWLVPSTFFFCINDGEIIWHIQIRHHINHPNLKDVWWHIWYWIVPWEWNRWYWKKQLQLGLEEAKKLGLDKVMISSLDENIASYKIIESCWGILKKERILNNPPKDMLNKKGKKLKIYWITL